MIRRIKAASAESNQLQEPARRLPDVQKQVANLEAKRDTMKQEIEQLNHSAARLTKQRERLARLLVCLAENSSEDLLVQRIDSDTGDPRIHGVCLKPELADQFAKTLAEKLRPFGWEVQAPEKQAKNLVAGGAPWEFDMILKSPSEPAGVKTKLKAAKGPGLPEQK